MIRPITFICFVLALGSGLYLYQSKHTAQMLDHTIEKTARDTDAVREQTRALKTEWTLLNEPDRLRQLAEQYLPALKPLAPTQFTTLADLNSRLPAAQAIAPEPAPVAEAPAVAAADEAAQAGSVVADASQTEDAADAMPVPPIPPQAPVAVASATSQVAPQTAAIPVSSTLARPSDRKPAAPAIRPVALAGPSPRVPSVEARATETRQFDTRAAETRAVESRPVELRGPEQPRLTDYRMLTAPRPARSAPMSPSQGGGSLLGMARGPDSLPPPLPMPLPRPTPVNAWSNTWPNGG